MDRIARGWAVERRVGVIGSASEVGTESAKQRNDTRAVMLEAALAAATGRGELVGS